MVEYSLTKRVTEKRLRRRLSKAHHSLWKQYVCVCVCVCVFPIPRARDLRLTVLNSCYGKQCWSDPRWERNILSNFEIGTYPSFSSRNPIETGWLGVLTTCHTWTIFHLYLLTSRIETSSLFAGSCPMGCVYVYVCLTMRWQVWSPDLSLSLRGLGLKRVTHCLVKTIG